METGEDAEGKEEESELKENDEFSLGDSGPYSDKGGVRSPEREDYDGQGSPRPSQ